MIEDRCNPAGTLLAFLGMFIVAGMVFLALVGSGDVQKAADTIEYSVDQMRTQANAHAVVRHGVQAQEAIDWIESLPNAEYCRWQCPDGRDRYLCSMPGGKWAVMVIEAGEMVTAFITSDRDYILNVMEPCKNHWRYAD